MVPYHIISTGSQGNAVVVDTTVLVDCGVSYKAVEPFVPKLKLVLLTHIHSDHFRPSTLRRMANERPTLRFACCRWLADDLAAAGVPESNIDILRPGTMYGYGICNVIPFHLTHDVPNCGYKLHFPAGKVFYATDTSSLNGIAAPRYDLYLVEANYEDADIRARIAKKWAAGEYAYEIKAMRNHLSKAKCDDFIYRNIGPNGTYVYLHRHVDREVDKCEANCET